MVSDKQTPIPVSQAMFGFAESMKQQEGAEAVVAWADQVARSAFDLETDHAAIEAKLRKATMLCARVVNALGAIVDAVDDRDPSHAEKIRAQLQRELPEFAKQFERKHLVLLR